jgi:hypothetical protein
MPRKKFAVELISPPRKKSVPRSAFKKGERTPHQWTPGTSGNPSGRAKSDTRLLSRGLRAALPCRAPAAFCRSVGLPPTSSWSQVIVESLLRAGAKGDIAAIREIREATEGSRSRVDLVSNETDAPPRLIEVVFVESDGDGRPRRYSSIEENLTPYPLGAVSSGSEPLIPKE